MTFEAKYHGDCAACGWRILPGNEVQYNAEDDLVHVHCPEKEDLRAVREVCNRCFMEKSVTGSCGCDD